MANLDKLIIGSAGFSSPYGINLKKPPSIKEIKKIFDFANVMGISKIDTAENYGNVNQLISDLNLNRFDVMTKFNGLNESYFEIKRKFYQNLKDLKIKSFYSVLFHRSSFLLTENGKSFYNFLKEQKEQKVIRNIGVSIYTPRELDELLGCYDFDIVQAPINIADNRIIDYWTLHKSELMKTKLHARSIYLQGLLLKDFNQIEDKFKGLKPLLIKKKKMSVELNINTSELLLNYVYSMKLVDNIIIGFWGHKEIEEAVNNIINFKRIDFSNIQFHISEKIIDPTQW